MIINDISIDWDIVAGMLARKERVTPDSPEMIRLSVRESIEKAQSLARPQALVIGKKISAFNADSIELGPSSKLSGVALSSYLAGAKEAFIFLVTIGSALEDEASGLMNAGETLQGYMLDRTASTAVEYLAESLETRIRKDREDKGMSVSMRMSPGYCDWPVEEQLELNIILDFSRVGVHLTENCMMIPRKSISGLVGIGAKGHFVRQRSQCVICAKKGCDYRRT